MTQFTPARPRDAWGPIRGFVYQVDLTIERWLGLAVDQAIELERGEDIDLIARALAGDQEAHRQLEQVKHRDTSLTLRAAEIAAALANAVEHLGANADLTLLFRFTTNASVGREKPSPMPGKRRALEVWEEIRTGRTKPGDVPANLAAIRSLLSSLAKPEDLNKGTWAGFQRFLKEADDTVFLKLVQAFEWSTRATPAKDMDRKIRAALLRLGHAPDGRAAELLYQRLFLRVFKLLSEPGLKRLTPADLAAEVAAGQLAPADRQLLDAVRGRVDALEQRVDQVQRQLDEHSTAVDTRINELAAAQGIRAAVDYTVQAVSLSAPAPVARLARRAATVARMGSLLANHAWLSLHGPPGTGLTELAKLIRASRAAVGPWIDFAGLTRDQAALRLDSAATVPAPSAAQDRRAAYDALCARVASAAGTGGIIVLNDMPDLDGRDALSARLPDFAAACRACGLRLLSTSTKPLPASIRGLFADDELACEAAPPLTDDEAAELFAAHGAPAGALPARLVHIINTLAGGHPTLLAAAARYLARLTWRLTEQEAGALLRGQYAVELRPETTARLADEIADADARQLLYRLNFTIGTFDVDDAVALATVEPPLTHPLERLDQLTDVCVVRAPDQKLRVSPLFRTLGARDVPPATAAACHVRLAETIVRRERISPYDAAGAFSHFIAGGAVGRAGILLLRALAALDEQDPPFEDALLGSVYDHAPLPEEMDLGVRILVRAHQIRICGKLPRDSSYALAELDRLLAAAGDKEAWAVLGAGIVMTTHFATRDLPRANRYLAAAMTSLPTVRAAMAGHWQPPDFDPELLFWPNALNVGSAADLSDWMSTIDRLTAEQRRRFFSHELAQGGSLYMAERLWLQELEKKPGLRDWAAVDEALRRLGDWAATHDAVLLDAAAARLQIVIRSEQMKNLDGAIIFAEQVLARLGGHGAAMYLVLDAIGAQLVFRGRPEEGSTWLTAALRGAGDTFLAQRVMTHLYLARAASDLKDPAQAVNHSRAAVDLVEAQGEDVGHVLAARALGELSVALWLKDGAGAPFPALNAAFDHLLEARAQGLDTSDDWRGAMVAFSHVCGYLASIAGGGSPPKDDDGEQRPPPRVGLMTSAGANFATAYQPAKFPVFFGSVAVYADAVGAEDEAARRAVQGLEAARAGNSIITVSSLGTTYLPYLVLAGRAAEVIDAALESAAALVALQRLRASGADVFAVDRTIEEILGPKPSPAWSQVEAQAQLIGLLPLALRIATIRVGDPAGAAANAADAAAACRIVAAGASTPAVWNAAAAILETGFVTGGSGRELADGARAAKSAGNAVLGAIGFLAASLQDDVPVGVAAQIHVHVLADVARWLGIHGPTGANYLRVAVPFIETYWSRVFRDQRFRFTPPALVGRQLVAAATVPLPRRAQAVLIAVLDGLGVAPPEERDWLEAK